MRSDTVARGRCQLSTLIGEKTSKDDRKETGEEGGRDAAFKRCWMKSTTSRFAKYARRKRSLERELATGQKFNVGAEQCYSRKIITLHGRDGPHVLNK